MNRSRSQTLGFALTCDYDSKHKEAQRNQKYEKLSCNCGGNKREERGDYGSECSEELHVSAVESKVCAMRNYG